MNDTDELAAETRQLIDAATKGEWGPTIYRGTGLGWDVDGPEAGIRGQFENEADAELIAAAPRLLANWLAREERPTREVEWVRAVQYGAKVVEQRDDAIAERDRLADENRALRELAGFLIDACATHRIDVPFHSSLLDLAADIAGGDAADRGVTDGDRNEGDEE